MRIAVLPTIRDFAWGAPGDCMGALVKCLLDEGHTVLWLVAPIDLAHPEVVRLKASGASVVSLPAPPPTYVRLSKLRVAFDTSFRPGTSLKKIFGEFDPEHLFINQGGTWSAMQDHILECLPALRGKYSLICHLNHHQPAFPHQKLRVARDLVMGASRVFFNSEWTKRLAEAQIAMTIGAAAYFQYPVRFEFNSPLPWPNSTMPQIAMVNRLDLFHKGIDLALQAIKQLEVEHQMVGLEIYGSGQDAEFLKELTRFLEISHLVKFNGYADDVRSVWLENEMLLLPSRHEGLAVAALEAMGFGRPVLRTPYGGAAEWIRDGENGYICPAAEVDLLVATLKRALQERARWQEMGAAAHEMVKRELDPLPARVFLQALDLR